MNGTILFLILLTALEEHVLFAADFKCTSFSKRDLQVNENTCRQNAEICLIETTQTTAAGAVPHLSEIPLFISNVLFPQAYYRCHRTRAEPRVFQEPFVCPLNPTMVFTSYEVGRVVDMGYGYLCTEYKGHCYNLKRSHTLPTRFDFQNYIKFFKHLSNHSHDMVEIVSRLVNFGMTAKLTSLLETNPNLVRLNFEQDDVCQVDDLVYIMHTNDTTELHTSTLIEKLCMFLNCSQYYNVNNAVLAKIYTLHNIITNQDLPTPTYSRATPRDLFPDNKFTKILKKNLGRFFQTTFTSEKTHLLTNYPYLVNIWLDTSDTATILTRLDGIIQGLFEKN